MQFKLKKKLKEMKEGKSYDYVLIDTPPSLGILTVNTLTAATEVLIPVQTQYFAMDGVVQLMETVNKVREDINPELSVMGAVLTMYDRRTILSREVASRVRHEFSEGKVYTTVIPVNVRLAEAPSYHKSIIEYDSGCNGAKAYGALAEEILSCPEGLGDNPLKKERKTRRSTAQAVPISATPVSPSDFADSTVGQDRRAGFLIEFTLIQRRLLPAKARQLRRSCKRHPRGAKVGGQRYHGSDSCGPGVPHLGSPGGHGIGGHGTRAS